MAFPLNTDAALCSCFQILRQDLAPILLSEDLLSIWDIGRELKNCENYIKKVQDLLNSAEERIKEICVSNWMDNLIELSYDMENLVDEMNRKRDRMDQHVAFRNQARTSHDAAHEYSYWDNIADYRAQGEPIKGGINDVSARLEKVLKVAKDLELTPQVGERPVSSRVKEDVGPYVDESDVYGRQKDKDIVIQKLLSSTHSSKKNYSVFSIAGMGGVGKTTLARIIFHDERVKNFDVRSWACVSDAFDSEKVVKELIGYFPGDYASTTAPSALRPRLVHMVKDKKILIVLDDVWEKEAWDSLKVLFTDCARGSKILVTTRNKNVGNIISNKECYELKVLEDEDCWHLFKGVAFGEEDDKKFEKIGREIVKKCNGVPLALKVVGSTLRYSDSEERWENALRNELWLVEDGASDKIFPALKLSYCYLPSYLKRCFRYLSLFPTDYKLKKDKVVRLWIAEGFIEDRDGRSWEAIGDEYYKELQRRCLIQEDDKMHDLIHSLACSVSGNFSYRIGNGTKPCMHMGSVRHLSVSGKDVDLEALDKPKHLRTLFLFNGHHSKIIFDQRLLRVLYLERTTLQELPICEERLKCLRYLEISWSNVLEYLPDSICELQNLQTLELRNCDRLRSLPNDIGDLQKLRYLCFHQTSLSELPSSVERLKCLRYLEISRSNVLEYLPDSICKLQNLQTLVLNGCVCLRSLPNDIGDLQKLRYLCLHQISLSELPISVGRLKCLQYLEISWSNVLEYLPDSICELQNLQTLNLKGNGLRSLPNDIGNLQKLRFLHLKHTLLSVLPMSIVNLLDLLVLDLSYCRGLSRIPEDIGNLVSLQELYLQRVSISSLPDSICKLKRLSVLNLQYCNSFSNLPDEIGALQDLMELILSFTSISHLPKSIGNLHNLRKCYIHGCQKLTQLPEDVCNLSSLESLEFDKNLIRRLPRGIGGLRSIKRLDEFVVGKEEGWGIEELNGMNKLKGLLTISHLENVDSVEKARMASLKSKIDINDFYFKWSSMDDASDDSDDDASDDSNLGGVGFEALEDDASGDSDVGGVGLTTRDGEMEAKVLEALEPYPKYLVTLSLKNYHGERVPKWMAELRFPSLKGLILDGLQCVERVIMDVELPSLKLLRIENCPKLMVVSMAIPNLEALPVSSCQELTTLCLIPSLQGFTYASEIGSLQTIYIINCPGLVTFLDKGLPPMLRYLKVESSTTLPHLPRAEFKGLQGLEIASWKNLPHLGQNTSLRRLTIQDCPELVSFPEEGLPPMLRELKIVSCTNLRHLPRGLGHNTSLTSLTIEECPELVSFPEEGLPPMLEYLSIRNCTNLRHLPTGLRDLTSLLLLILDGCPVLGIRSDDQLPPNLRLNIVNCSKLEQQLKDEDRKDWLTKSFFYGVPFEN